MIYDVIYIQHFCFTFCLDDLSSTMYFLKLYASRENMSNFFYLLKELNTQPSIHLTTHQITHSSLFFYASYKHGDSQTHLCARHSYLLSLFIFHRKMDVSGREPDPHGAVSIPDDDFTYFQTEISDWPKDIDVTPVYSGIFSIPPNFQMFFIPL